MEDFPKGSQTEFERFLVRKYFEFGTVDAVLKKYRFSLPISYAQFQRVLDKFGVIKNVGPNGKFSETVEFLSQLAHDNIVFDDIHKKLPPSFKTSTSTLHRILSYVREGITRRNGAALIISKFNDPKRILLAKDISIPRIELGKKYGDLSLPMGYSKKGESRKKGITRILQNEVFTNLVLEGIFPSNIIPDNPEPFMYLDIADVRVAVYQIGLTKKLSSINSFSSYKLKDFGYYDALSIEKGSIIARSGVKESVCGYLRYLNYLAKNLKVNPLQNTSLMNSVIAEARVEVES